MRQNFQAYEENSAVTFLADIVYISWQTKAKTESPLET